MSISLQERDKKVRSSTWVTGLFFWGVRAAARWGGAREFRCKGDWLRLRRPTAWGGKVRYNDFSTKRLASSMWEVSSDAR